MSLPYTLVLFRLIKVVAQQQESSNITDSNNTIVDEYTQTDLKNSTINTTKASASKSDWWPLPKQQFIPLIVLLLIILVTIACVIFLCCKKRKANDNPQNKNTPSVCKIKSPPEYAKYCTNPERLHDPTLLAALHKDKPSVEGTGNTSMSSISGNMEEMTDYGQYESLSKLHGTVGQTNKDVISTSSMSTYDGGSGIGYKIAAIQQGRIPDSTTKQSCI